MDATRRELAKWILAGAAGQLMPLGQANGQAQAASGKANPRLGINIAGPAYYNTEYPFVDLFRMSRDWELKWQYGGMQTQADKPNLDENGWITNLPSGARAETVLAVLGHVPPGIWSVLYEGVGKIEVWGQLEVLREEPGRIQFRVKSHDKAEVWVRLWRTDPTNYVRNIRVLMPGHGSTYQTNPWNPTFLQHWQGMAALRFMDLMITNNSRISKWAERPRPELASFAEKGVALELLIDLANRLMIDPWFCMPHLADDSYIRQFATMVRDRLNSSLKIYLEYSNEVWNALFQQHHYAFRSGRSLKLAEDDFEAGLRYTALRAIQVFQIWEKVFGSHRRLVRVLASQAVNPWTASTMLSVQGAAQNADALSIANYIGITPSPNGKPSEAEASRWTLDDLFGALDKELARYEHVVRGNLAVAQRHGLKLVAYEGGQHLVGIQGAENNEDLTTLFRAANRHPRMGDLYRRMYRTWESAGGDLMCHFSSVSPITKWGGWGLLEYHDDDPSQSPKFAESMRWAKSRGQKVNFRG